MSLLKQAFAASRSELTLDENELAYLLESLQQIEKQETTPLSWRNCTFYGGDAASEVEYQLASAEELQLHQFEVVSRGGAATVGAAPSAPAPGSFPTGALYWSLPPPPTAQHA